jgi:hypothetical protein
MKVGASFLLLLHDDDDDNDCFTCGEDRTGGK